PHRSKAHVKIEELPQRDVQRSDAAANRCRQRSFDSDEVLSKRIDCLVWQPVVELLETFFPGVHFFPGDLPPAAVRFLDGGIEDARARAPDVATGAVAFDERNDRIVGDLGLAVPQRDCSGHILSVTSPVSRGRSPRTGWQPLWTP